MTTVAQSAKGRGGFLLVEILVALSVVAVMAALMASFLGQLGAVSRLENQIAARTELDAAVSYLQRTLAGVKKAPLLDNEPKTHFLFDGLPEEVRFAAVTRQGFYSLALRDFKIFIDRSGGRTRLLQTLTPRRLVNGAPVSPNSPTLILQDIDSVSFEYGDGGGGFSSKWKTDGILPSAVKVTLFRTVGGKQISASAIARIL